MLVLHCGNNNIVMGKLRINQKVIAEDKNKKSVSLEQMTGLYINDVEEIYTANSFCWNKTIDHFIIKTGKQETYKFHVMEFYECKYTVTKKLGV